MPDLLRVIAEQHRAQPVVHPLRQRGHDDLDEPPGHVVLLDVDAFDQAVRDGRVGAGRQVARRSQVAKRLRGQPLRLEHEVDPGRRAPAAGRSGADCRGVVRDGPDQDPGQRVELRQQVANRIESIAQLGDQVPQIAVRLVGDPA